MPAFCLMGGKSLISALDKVELRAGLVVLLEPLVNGHRAELVDVEIKGARGNELVKLLVYDEGGVSLALCESISREVADLLDVEDPISGRYRLEVTSPGLDRPLVSNSDYARASGRLLKAKLKSGQVVKGRLLVCDDELIKLESNSDTLTVVRSEIAKANIEPEF